MIHALGLLLSIAFAQPAPGADAPDLSAFERGLATAATRAFEKRLDQPLGPKSIEAILSAQYDGEADRAYLAKLHIAEMPPYKLRSFSQRGEVYTLTAPNGRTFTMTSTDAGRTLRVNGVRIAYRELSLEAYLTALNEALRRTFVTRVGPWSLLGPREAAAFPFPGVLGAAAYGVMMTYRKVTGKNVYEQLTERMEKAKATCDFERRDPLVNYSVSATFVTLTEVKAQYADMVAKHRVPTWCKVGLPNDPTEGGNPRFDNADLRKTCAAAREFVACAEEFRREPADPTGTVNFIQKASGSSSAR